MSAASAYFPNLYQRRFTAAPDMATVRTGESQAVAGAKHPSLFADILPAEYAKISAAARVREFARGEMLCIEGDTVQQVVLLTSGSAKTTQVGLSGMEVILRISGPGDALGADSLFTSGKHLRTTQAFQTCRVMVWDAHIFKGLVDRYPILYRNMARILSEELRELEWRFHEIATEKVGPRVARQLVRLHGKIGQPVKGAVEVRLLREDLAQMTGTTLFTVSRLFSTWEASGILRPRREAVLIDNFEALREISVS